MSIPPLGSLTELYTLIEQKLPLGRVWAGLVLQLAILWFSAIAVTSIWNLLAPVLSITADVTTLPRPSFRLVDAVFLGTILAIMFIANKAIRHSHWFHMTVWDRFDAVNKSLDTLAEIVRKLVNLEASRHDQLGRPPSQESPSDSHES